MPRAGSDEAFPAPDRPDDPDGRDRGGRGPSAWEAPGALALFTVLAIAHTWPLARHLTGRLQTGPDPRAMMWSLFDLARNLVGDPLHLMDGTAFYPFRDTLAVLDHQIGNAVLAVPLILADASPVTVYNCVFLSTFILSGFFTYLLVRRLTGSTAAALLAGVAFAFSTARIYTLPHTHLLATQWLPLALLTLHRWLERPTVARWLAFAASTLLLALSSWQIAVIGAVTVGIVALWTMVSDRRRTGRRVLGLGAVAAVCVAFLLPLARVYGEVAARWPPAGGGGVGIDVLLRNSATWTSLTALPRYSATPYAEMLPAGESPIFPGVVTILLALPAMAILRGAHLRWSVRGGWARALRGVLRLSVVLVAVVVGTALFRGESPVVSALRPLAPVAILGGAVAIAALALAWRMGRQDRRAALAVTYGSVALAGLLFALGPRVLVGPVDVGSGLWRLDLLPIPLLMRAPVRFSLLMALGVAVLIGLGTSRLLPRLSRRGGLALVIVALALLNVDLAFTMPDLDPVPEPSAVDRWLARSTEPGAVLEFPLFVLDGNYWAMYASQELYDRRNVEGQGYLRPPELRRIRLLPDFSDLQVEMIWEHFHPRFVVLRGDLYAPEERQRVERRIDALGGALQLLEEDGADRLYELHDRGSGPRLFRRWPLEEILASGEVLRFRARLTPGRDGTVGRIVVLVNDHVAEELQGPEIRGGRTEVVPLEREHLVWGMNTVELRAGYRLADDVVARPVGETGTSIRADVEVVAEADGWRILVNAVPFANEGDVFLATIDPATGDVIDTLALELDTGIDVAATLASFVGGLPQGAPVAIAIRGSAAGELGDAAAAALRQLGVDGTGLVGPGSALAAVGVKGVNPGTAMLSVGADARVILGEPEGRRVRLRFLTLESR